MAMVFTAKAQQKEPNIVITFKESDKTVELAVGGQKGDEFQIDWGTENSKPTTKLPTILKR